MYELHFLQVWCAVALGAGRAGAWPAAWRLRLEQRDRVEVADVRLDEGFGGAGDEMVAPGAARALGLALDGERLRPLHDMLQQRLPTHPLRLPWDEVDVSREEVAALQQRLERRRLSVADGSGRRHQRGDDASAGADEDEDADVDVEVDEDYPDAEWPSDGHAAALRPRAADAAGATVASPSTASPDYDYSRLRAEERAREAAALRRAGVRGSTEPPPPRRRHRLSWRAWLLRELFAWGSAADMQCERMSRWHVGARALRCHAQDALAHLLARSGAPLRDRLQGARESLGRLLLPLSFWCTVYALWAVPLWCTRGWCCCCCYCCCHFCRPDASLDEVRAYTGLNPPGVWRAKGGDAPVFYAPSQREVDAYGRLYKKLRNVLL